VNVPIDYSSRDYESYRSDLLALAPTLTPEWTDFYPTDIGVVLVEAFSYLGDNLSYYIDRAANETYLPTATQRRSVINLGRLVGYELSPATSAIVSMSFTCTGAGSIPAGTRVATDPTLTGEEQVIYEVTTATAVGGPGTVTVDCIEGQSITDEILGSGNALPDQEFQLDRTPLSYDPSGISSLRVYVDEGSGFVLYTEVPNFLDSEPLDRHYTVRIDEDDRVTVRFGNGVDGRVAAGGSNNVKASYRVGGGEFGNSVGKGQITKLLDTLAFVSSVTNGNNTPQGGSDKESIDEARTNIPASLKALDRAVTHADYEALAVAGVAGVAQAKATYGVGPFEEVVYVAATGSNPIASGTWDPILETGTGLIGQVGSYLVVRKAAPTRLVVRPPSEVPLEMAFSIDVNAGFFQADTEVDARQAILDLVENARMGEDLVLSDVMGALESLAGVNKVRFSLFRRQPTAVLRNPDPFLVVNTPDTTWIVTTTDDTDHEQFVLTSDVQPTLQEVLEVEFISPTQYRVRGASTGDQSSLGTVGTTWTNDLGNLRLLATAGAIPNYAGNRYRITVGSGAVVTHVQVGEYEITTLDDADISVTGLSGGIK
jgi:hypothetical protein